MKALNKVLAGTLALVWSAIGLAQTSSGAAAAYPDKPIRLIVPYAAGGGGDAVFRTITEPLAIRMGKPIYFDYKPGAGGTIGMDVLAHSAPDGYSIGVGSSDALALAPALFPKLPYDAHKDMTPISIVAEMPLVLLVRADSPITSFEDLLKTARAGLKPVSFGTPGHGSSPHVMGELLAKAAKVELTHIPYKGTAPAINDLLGGQVTAVITSGFDAVPLEKAGRVRTIGVTGTKRYPLLPGTPTFQERGIEDVNELLVWFGLFAPANTPQPIIDKLSAGVTAILGRDDFRVRAAELGFVPVVLTPESFKARVRADIDRLAAMVARTGVKAN